MSATELLLSLERRGFVLVPREPGRLVVKPAKELTDSLRETIRHHKAELLLALAHRPRPYLNDRGELIIPTTSAPKYHWWANGQSITDTLRELNASSDIIMRYVEPVNRTTH